MSSLNNMSQPKEADARALAKVDATLVKVAPAKATPAKTTPAKATSAKATPANEVPPKSGTQGEHSVKNNVLMESENAKLGTIGFREMLRKSAVEDNVLRNSSNAMLGQISSSETGDK